MKILDEKFATMLAELEVTFCVCNSIYVVVIYIYLFSSPYKSTGRAPTVATASVKVFKRLYLLNFWKDVVHTNP